MASQKYCFVCGFNFIAKQLSSEASSRAVVSIDEPPEWYNVLNWQLSEHFKSDGSSDIPTMRVTYSTLAVTVSEFVAFEHYKFGPESSKYYAYERARKWHNMTAFRHDMPNTVTEALDMPYRMPTKILLKKEGKYWRISDYSWEQEQKMVNDSLTQHVEYFDTIPF